MNYGRVANRRGVETSFRNEVLSFAHHRHVASFAPELQREWLARAVEGEDGKPWSSNQLKAAIAQDGEELNELEPAKGTRGSFRGKPKGRGSSGGPIMELPDDSAPTLAEMGVNRKYAARAKRLAEIPEGKRQQYIVELIEAEKGVTPAAVLANQRVADLGKRLRNELRCD